jgi:hypothetical protein
MLKRAIHMNNKELPVYKDWKIQNASLLAEKFHQKFGNQMHEYHDFCEEQYAKAQRAYGAISDSPRP